MVIELVFEVGNFLADMCNCRKPLEYTRVGVQLGRLVLRSSLLQQLELLHPGRTIYQSAVSLKHMRGITYPRTLP